MGEIASAFEAHVCRSYGDYRDLTIEELPLVGPARGEVLVRNQAFAVGFPDLLTIQGKYQRKPSLPFVPGSEFCGEVVAVGEAWFFFESRPSWHDSAPRTRERQERDRAGFISAT